MVLGGFLEFILGNTFPFVVFCSFGAFWLTFAATLQPFYNAYGAYGSATATSQAETLSTGIASQGFNASFGFFLLAMGLLCFIYLICSLRTNVVFVVIFASLVIAFGLLTGAYFQIAMGTNADLANRLVVVSLDHLRALCVSERLRLTLYRVLVQLHSSRRQLDGGSFSLFSLRLSTFHSRSQLATCRLSSRAQARRKPKRKWFRWCGAGAFMMMMGNEIERK